jgi:hypothetical protein
MAYRERRSGVVSGGSVETVNSTAVGDGRRMRRYGVVVSILILLGGDG